VSSDDYVMLHVQPGSNALACTWINVDRASGEASSTAGRAARHIGIFERASNGGGTVRYKLSMNEIIYIIYVCMLF